MTPFNTGQFFTTENVDSSIVSTQYTIKTQRENVT